MAEIINLRRARKARDKASSRREADANALKHGRRKSDRDREEREGEVTRLRLDGHRMEEDE